MASDRRLGRLRLEVGELLARHERGRGLTEFREYAADPVGFIREVLAGEPWSAQEDIALAVRDHPQVAVRSGNSIGKDWLAARLALWWVYCRGGLALLTGPTDRQVREVLMHEVRQAWTAELPGELFERGLRVDERDDRRGIIAFTSTEVSRLTGFHAPRVLGVISEAQGVEAHVFEALHRCATGEQDRLLVLGNPVEPSGPFHAAHRPASGWRTFRIPVADHPNLREGRVVIPGGPTAAFVERIEREYGRGSSVFSYAVLGEFPEDSDEGLVRRAWLEAAAARRAGLRAEALDEPPCVAVDPARLGPDRTVVAVRRGAVLDELITLPRADTMTTTGHVSRLLHRLEVTRSLSDGKGLATWGSGEAVVDLVGLGAGVHDRLREAGYSVRGFNGGERARDAARFANRRAESAWHLRELLEAGRIGLPDDAALFEEATRLRWRPTSDGRVALEAKDDLRSRIGRSPDRLDAAMMCFERFASSRHSLPDLPVLRW